MKLTAKKLLTIVAEAAVESRLVRDLVASGAKGYTISGARGAGPRNQRNGDLEGGNIRIEVVADQITIDKIISILETNYFPNYAVSLWLSDVEVLRDSRY